MKLQVADTSVLIGKRVTLGAAINSLVLMLGFYFPEHQQALLASAIPLTLIAQIAIAHNMQITNHD